jgi:hypothetical protein
MSGGPLGWRRLARRSVQTFAVSSKVSRLVRFSLLPPRVSTPAVSTPASVRSILGQLALAFKMAASSASDMSSGCFLVCSLRSIHNPASLA